MQARARQIRFVVLWFCLAIGLSSPLFADPIRVATFNASLSRNGPGVLLADLRKDTHRQIEAVAQIIRITRPDILLINEFDFDVEKLAVDAFVTWLRKDGEGTKGIDYPFAFARSPNTGLATGLDLNADGKANGPEDAHGYGRFHGQYGMLVLSRFPIETNAARAFSKLLWADLPGADLPKHGDGAPYPTPDAQLAIRLSSKSHWDVPINVDGRVLHLFASHPTPPVFDGPEDRNGKRNADEIRFWTQYIDGASFADDEGRAAPRRDAPFVVLGDLNADPLDGDGIHDAIAGLLKNEHVQDPKPESKGAAVAAELQGGANSTHKGDASLDTADWNDARGPGNLRVDFVLPSKGLIVTGAGVFWPAPDAPNFDLIGDGKPASSDHRLVWVDLNW